MKIMAGSLLVGIMFNSACAVRHSNGPVVISGTEESVRMAVRDNMDRIRQVPLPTKKFKHLFILKEGASRATVDYLYVNDFAVVKESFPADKQYPRREGYWLEVRGDRQWLKDWGDGQIEELCWEGAYHWLYAKDDYGRLVGAPSDALLLQIKAPSPQQVKPGKCLSAS